MKDIKMINKKLPLKKKTVLCLRTVDQNRKAYKNFQWPKLGFVEAPDWNKKAVCGQGLHGYLRGCGDAESIKFGGLFQVVKVIEKEIVLLDGKVKFPRCEVVFTGSQKEATDLLIAAYPGLPVIGATVVVEDKLTATAGNYGTATAGNHGTATAGNYGTATAGNHCTATAGNYGTATAGDNGTATAGDNGTATAGYYGTATAGYNGKATAGDDSTATAGNHGTATAGYYGTATAGDGGTVMAGDLGKFSLLYYDQKASRRRQVIGYVGEDGLLPNVAYKLDTNNKFIKV